MGSARAWLRAKQLEGVVHRKPLAFGVDDPQHRDVARGLGGVGHDAAVDHHRDEEAPGTALTGSNLQRAGVPEAVEER